MTKGERVGIIVNDVLVLNNIDKIQEENMLKKRFLRAVALLLVIATLGMLFIACGSDDENNGGNNNNANTNQNNNSGTGGNDSTGSNDSNNNNDNNDNNDDNNDDDDNNEDNKVLVDNVPDMDMQAYTMTVLCRENVMFLQEAYAEDGTGDQVTQSIYDRNYYIENRFNCFLTYEPVSEEDEGTLTKTFNKAVASGTQAYTLALGHMMYTANECLNGTMLDIKSLPYVNLDREYWHQSMNEAIEVNNKIYFTASDYCTSSTYYTWLMIFNMTTCAEKGIDVYGMVDNGTWTIDNLTDIASVNYADDGDKVVDFEDDKFGFLIHYNTAITNWMFALDIPVTTNPKDGLLELSFGNERSVKAAEKIYKLLFGSNNGSFVVQDLEFGQTFDPANPDMKITAKFGQGDALIAATKIYALENLRESDVLYGIVPYPKYDTAQENYYSHVDGRASLLFVPYILPESEYEYVGGLLEALTCATTNMVMPVIQLSALLGRYSEDSEAYKHLQDTLAGRSYAFAYVFNSACTSKPYWIFSKMMAAKTDNLTNFWKAFTRTAQRELRGLARDLEELHTNQK